MRLNPPSRAENRSQTHGREAYAARATPLNEIDANQTCLNWRTAIHIAVPSAT
ncbi:Uncharacterised protein [Vibrio cholerae]|nr:Uncharacterised protein [Vibrio cholerae]